MEGVAHTFCCDWAFWWLVRRGRVGGMPKSATAILARSSIRSGDIRRRSWDLRRVEPVELLLVVMAL